MPLQNLFQRVETAKLLNQQGYSMKTNVGGIDRVLRIILGVVMISAGVYLHNWWGVIGAVPLLTGLIRWCPLYMPFGLSSCATAPKSE